MIINRGDIYYIKGLNHDGHVQAGERPAIIVSNNANNKFSDVFEVVFLTTKKKKELPTHVKVMAYKMSTALCEQVSSVSINRLGEYIRTCSEAEMNEIDKALKISLSLTNE